MTAISIDLRVACGISLPLASPVGSSVLGLWIITQSRGCTDTSSP